VPTTCPGEIVVSTRYDTYAFTNAGGPTCYTVYLDNGCGLFATTYLGSFNPTNLCANYLADLGYSFVPYYSFIVPAATNFVIVVNEIPDEAGGCDYTLVVTGGDCPPILHIAPASTNKVQLDWTTAAAGYQLERTNAMPGLTPWPAESTIPIVVNSRYYLTNDVSGSNNFYRLRKPVP
jgi:hypothetical protein